MRRPRAFTLVELLAVIGLITTLVGLLLPAMSRARRSAQSVTCMSNLRQWGQATLLYANQYQGWLPRRGQGLQPTVQLTRPTDWFNALPPMLRQPAYSDLVTAAATPHPGASSIWMCPAAIDNRQSTYFAYAMNMRLSTWDAPTPDRITHVGPSSTLVLFTEGPGPYCSVLLANQAYSPVARHGGRINIAFLDGHVASYTGQEIGCGVGDPKRSDVVWTTPYSTWNPAS